MDGSQKLPQRMIGAARERLSRGESVDTIALAIAGWMRYAAGTDENGRPIDVRDPLAAAFARIASLAAGDPPALARGMLGIDVVFGTMGANPDFAAMVTRHLQRLFSMGAAGTIACHLRSQAP